MKKIYKNIFSKLSILNLDIHTNEVIKKSFASLIIKMAGMITGLLISLFVARSIGAEGLGVINLSNKIVGILVVLGLAGMRQVIIKEVAIAKRNRNFVHVNSVMNTAYILNVGLSILISSTLIILSPWLASNFFNEPKLEYPLIILTVMVTPQIISRIISGGLIGYKKIWQSNLVESSLSALITGFLLFITYILNYEINIKIVAVFYAIGRICVTIVIGMYWRKISTKTKKNKYLFKNLISVSMPLFIVSISFLIGRNVDVILIGSILNVKAVALYTVAAKLALVSSFILQVINSAIAPKIASMYKQNEKVKLQLMISRVIIGTLVIGFIFFILIVFIGKPLLSVWGNYFKNAYFVLIILSFGQLINLGTSCVGTILMMTGFEKILAKVSLMTMFLNLFLLYFLTKEFGIIGAAIAVTLTVIIENSLKYYYTVKYTEIKLFNF